MDSNRFITNKTPSNKSNISYTDILKHDKSSNCWVSLNNNVYDLSKYKEYLKNKKNKNVSFGLNCGENYDGVNERDMISHGHPEYKNFMIGKVKNYYLYKFLYMLLKLIVVILLLLAYKKTNNIIIILLLIIYIGYFLVVIHNTYSSKQKQTISSLSKIYKNNSN